jgi:hypothetical protein
VGIEQSRSKLANSIYATFEDANGRTRRTARTSDAASQAEYGIRRDAVIEADDAANALIVQSTALRERATIRPRANIAFTRVYDSSGTLVPNWLPRVGDTIVERSLNPAFGADVDRIRTFRIAELRYNVMTDTLEVTPEEPLPQLAVKS